MPSPADPEDNNATQNIQRRTIWGGHLSQNSNALMLAFCSGRDVQELPMADEELLPFDLWTNRAHAIMLYEQGILGGIALEKILQALKRLEDAWQEKKFQLDPSLEDVHINVEHWVSQHAGADAGGRLHTARSRNDQSGCDMRMLMRAALMNLAQGVEGLVAALLSQAQKATTIPMVGFTHHQPAMLTTWGHWLCAPAQGLLRDLARIHNAVLQINHCPLGAGAAYGVSWPIQRQRSAELLGFAGVDENSLDCISARGEHEAHCAFVYSLLMRRLAALAQDFLMFSHPYWQFIQLPEAFVTGSSIMPQKRNPDFAEVMKGKSAWVQGQVTSLLSITQGAMHGYHRDSQWSKYALLDVVRECQSAAPLMQQVVEGICPNRERMRARLREGYLEATDFADALSREFGLPFRQGYKIAAAAVGLSANARCIQTHAAQQAMQQAGLEEEKCRGILEGLQNPMHLLEKRQHTGGPAPLQVKKTIEHLQDQWQQQRAWQTPLRQQLQAADAQCRHYTPHPT